MPLSDTDNRIPQKSSHTVWPLYLFLAIFFIVGSGCLLYAPVKAVKTLLFIRNAALTTGTVEDFVAKRGSKSTTYAPAVTFTTPDGRLIRFTSRISGSTSAYNVGQRLEVYYDPTNEGNAEIKGFIPLWMPVIILSALGLAFSGIGGGMIYAIRRSVKDAEQKEALLRNGVPEWEAESDWQSATIRSATGREAAFFWLFATVWNAIAQPTGFICINAVIYEGNRLAAIGLMFPLVGFWLLWEAVRRTLQIRIFGDIQLRMDPFPASIGGEAGGTIELPVRFSSGYVFAVSLSCEQVIKHHDGSRKELVWQEGGCAASTLGPAGTRIAFRVAVPATEPPSSDSHQWTVRITAELPGLDLDRSFVIPVIREEPPRTSRLTVPLAPDLMPCEELPVGTVQVERQGGRLLLRYPCRRNLMTGLLFAFFSGWFLGGTSIFVFKSPGMGFAILPIFGMTGAGLLLYAVWLLSNSLQVAVGAGELSVVRRLFGIPVYSSRIETALVRRVEIVKSGSRRTGKYAKVNYRITADCGNGTTITLGDGVEGRTVAEEIARQLRQEFGLIVPAAAPLEGKQQLQPQPIAVTTERTLKVATTMTCPKCGVTQPITDTCTACQVIIAKYVKRQSLMTGSSPSPATEGRQASYKLRFVIAAISSIVCIGGGWQWWVSSNPYADRTAESNSYRSEKFKFAVSVPADWKRYSVKEAISCATIRKEYADQYLFLASPSKPDESLLVVNISGVSLDNFKSFGWDGYVAQVAGRNTVTFSDIKEINGLKVHRIGYEIAGSYREDALFEAGNKLIEIYFYVPLGNNTADRVAETRAILEDNLRKL